MFRVAVAALLIVVTVADVAVYMDDDWGSFKQRYNKHYSTQTEEDTRRSVWEGNVKYIQQHNKEADIGIHSYRLGVNKFADMTPEEVVGQSTGFVDVNRSQTSYSGSGRNTTDLPLTVDWRNENCVTPVKDQKQCQSSWAFAAIEALEGQHAKKTRDLVSLSEQNLVDCSQDFGNEGCDGGGVDLAFEYIKEAGGVETEADYPYEGEDGFCHSDQTHVKFTLSDFVRVKEGNVFLEDAVAFDGPIAVGFNAGLQSFLSYHGGVFDDQECSNITNHYGLLVGYGVSGDKAYWLVKNSWGDSWGEEGYVRMVRNSDNQCGICSDAILPIVS